MEKQETVYAELTVSITGAVSGTHLLSLEKHYSGSTQTYNPLEYLLPSLAEGGYVIDLQPLADHPQISTWSFVSPLPSGRIEGNEIQRLSEDARQFAADMAESEYGFEGAFQVIAELISKRVGEDPEGNAPGPFDYVSAACRASYWGAKGARIGRRRKSTLYWSDGTQQPIGTRDEAI